LFENRDIFAEQLISLSDSLVKSLQIDDSNIYRYTNWLSAAP